MVSYFYSLFTSINEYLDAEKQSEDAEQMHRNGYDISRVTEAIRVNVKFIHGPFSETLPTFYSNLQFGSTLSLVATKESNCSDVAAEFFVAA